MTNTAKPGVLVVTGGSRGIGAATARLAAARLGSPGEYVDYAASKGALDTMPIGLAHAILWLLSAEAAFTTGTFIEVAGGR